MISNKCKISIVYAPQPFVNVILSCKIFNKKTRTFDAVDYQFQLLHIFYLFPYFSFLALSLLETIVSCPLKIQINCAMLQLRLQYLHTPSPYCGTSSSQSHRTVRTVYLICIKSCNTKEKDEVQ